MANSNQHGMYYLPNPSHWPILGSIALFCLLLGAGNWLHHKAIGPYLCISGLLLLCYIIFGWFGTVVKENQKGLYNHQVDRSFRWSMAWFIFSEVMFFASFFFALLYVRVWTIPWLGGNNGYETTWYLLWPNFKAAWPLFHNPNSSAFSGPTQVMNAWGIPAINTLILLTSGLTITLAHFSLLKNKRTSLIIWLGLTVVLGFLFLGCQAHEYHEAYTEMGVKLNGGIYSTLFYMLTGFHGLHVTIGTITLLVMLIRAIKGHFTPENHFGFEAAAWYWHFVDVVWLFLFVFVYWL
ncbi:MAG: Cytochrome c oxidase subunit 3 [Legionellaceae bacterium]